MIIPVFLAALAAAQTAPREIINHHPFPIRQPLDSGPERLAASAEENGLRLRYRGMDAGLLTWALIVQPAAAAVDHVKQFRPLPLHFERVADADWEASAKTAGLVVTIKARVYRNGFLDTAISLRNASAREAHGMYAAAVALWRHPVSRARLLCYDNRAEDFDALGRTRFSAGEGRHWALQHGVDWLALDFEKFSATVLNSYSHSPTVLDDVPSAKNKGPRFVGANIPQFKTEARRAGDALYLITEFVRDNRPYRDRFVENRLPERGQVLTSRQRVLFEEAFPSRQQADQAFLAYNSYASYDQQRTEIGVPSVVFGTSYFPYSTLGENFGELKLPGQETDAFWPLSADTVTHWRKFADDIRRDLRIAKAMGFTVIRLHYVDVIARLPEPLQFEYLDFLFGELRHLGLRAMFSTAFTYWTPEQIAARVARYKDVIHRLEIENEVLIWGIPLDRPQYWSRIYSQVKKAAPEVQIHWTSHLNTGIFDRMDALRLKYDAVSAHAYIDALDAIPSGRGFALAIGSYARDARKPAIFTEWNWRGLTRMTPEARAEAYPPIIENLLATRSIREFYQFQFQQTMCVNPRTRKGIRQYEPLWLSRRPKPEALKLMELIDRYSDPATPNRQIGADRVVVDLVSGQGTANFRVSNPTGRTIAMKLSVEGPTGVETRLAKTIMALGPHAAAEVPVSITLANGALPGFYHVFLRLETPGGLVRYGWAEVRNAGQPAGNAGFDLNRPVAVVYGEKAPVIELEAAYLVHETIESASGRPVLLYNSADTRAPAALIVVGTPGTNPLAAAPQPGWLVLPTYDAAVDFVLKYWMHAKDSAARRIGLVKKNIPAGADVANLP